MGADSKSPLGVCPYTFGLSAELALALAFYNFIRPSSALVILLMTPLPINEITMIF